MLARFAGTERNRNRDGARWIARSSTTCARNMRYAPPGDVHDPKFKKIVEHGVCRHRPAPQALRGRIDLPRRAAAARCPEHRRLGRPRRGARRRADGPRRHQPAGRPPRAARRARRSSASGPTITCTRMAPLAEVKVRRRRRRAVPQPLQPGRQPRRTSRRSTRRIVAAGVAPAQRRRRPLDQPADPQGAGRGRPVGMVHIDAHCDTGGPFEGAKFHHGGPFRQAVLAGVLDPERTIQIGIRGGAEYLWEFSYASGMTVIHAEEVSGARHRPRHREDRARSSATGRPTSPSTSTASTRPSRPAPARRRSAA